MFGLNRMLTAVVLMAALISPMVVSSAMAQTDEQRIEVAQAKPKRNLFDLLFGPSEDKKPPVETQKTKPGSSSSPSISTLEPSKPLVEKAETATRLAVFGDSLAVDLAKALERSHAEDPNIAIIAHGVGSSGFVRDDFYDWNAAISEEITANSFDIAVVIIGINDRQPLDVDGKAQKPLTDEWKALYTARLTSFLDKLKSAGKPVIWVGLPPMQAPSYSAAMTQISSVHRLASFAGGAEFVDIYERFADEDGNYTSWGPDLNGQTVSMRKSDGIHFTSAGSDKLAFYVDQALKVFYRGGAVTLEMVDALEGTDAQAMMRMPFQGLGQIRLLEVAGAVVRLSDTHKKSSQLIVAGQPEASATGFDLETLVNAPEGRADAFGVGIGESSEER